MKVPKYYLIKEQILALIADLPPGSAVPTERELASDFGTSRTTVRQAIAELVVDGRLVRTQGSGTFVAQPKMMRVRPLSSFSQDLAMDGWRPGSVVLDISEVTADAELAGRLGVEPGARVQRVERLRTAFDEPIAHEVAYLPRPMPKLAEQLAEHGSLYRTLREEYGAVVATAEDIVETVLADPVTADLLRADTGLPMLLVRRTGWDAAGNLVEWTESRFRGDRFRFMSRQRLDDVDAVPGRAS
ncbi:MAG: GntR family transcriptional regulator [Micropruina sp.]|uniref:GntR family transcriptional regulator n=1 Tax=Micropruina sp. TaxID=2737536 RepID=UPI0039E39CCA